jgi:hypothetical protein
MIELFFVYLLLGAFTAIVMLVWFNTNAFVEYMTLLNLTHLFHINEYKEVTIDDPSTTYVEYIAANYSNFGVRMISCPKCLCIQLSGIVNLPIFAALSIIFTPFIGILFPLSVGITAYFSLYMHTKLVTLIKQ